MLKDFLSVEMMATSLLFLGGVVFLLLYLTYQDWKNGE